MLILNLFEEQVNEFNWTRAFSNTSINDKVNIFNNTILNNLSTFIPLEILTCDDKDPPWFNKKVKGIIQGGKMHLTSIAIIVATPS